MLETLKYSFKHSLPIFFGFLPLAIAYGILMQDAGYNFLWTGACSLFVFAGSLQFLMISFFAGGVSLVSIAIMALMINSRHIFYGISFIEKFRKFGFWKYFLIFALTDENYSLHCSHDIKEGINEKWAYVFTAAWTLLYWAGLSVAGALIGSFIPFDTTGIDFALTALFIVILINQMKGATTVLPAIIAFTSSIVCLALLGPSNFILPSLMITVVMLTVFRGRIERKGDK
ncbi:MAG: AzlC family ABC transporter permease [Eubacterium sp.]|nr:AzlC family ABC transporter permease [Eubacterium sp.]